MSDATGDARRHHLAQFNVGRLRGPVDSPELRGFAELLEPVNALADAAPGFVWRLRDEETGDATTFRPYEDPDVALNLSVWESVDALRDFVYRSGSHLDAMRRRREWFHPMRETYLVLWWVPAGHLPGLPEAMERLELLRAIGPGPDAFTFRDPYPAPDAEPAPDADRATNAVPTTNTMPTTT
ncbi:MAG: DUF3291 domain-containing protein [Streptosporangiales bacterium]|nr:DUF3291 domain-containing protein [Streptosporangiales bacterium]